MHKPLMVDDCEEATACTIADIAEKKRTVSTIKKSATATAATAVESDAELLLHEIEAALPHPIWTKEQLNSVQVPKS